MKTMTLSVLQLNQYIKRIIDNEELLIGIGLFGEVSNFKISGGNAFFDLKEEGAAISCTMFGQDVVPLENGKQVMLYGRLSFYPKMGKLTFIARRVELLGKGALYEKYLKLKDKLEKEGLFDTKIKKEIPRFAKKIGLVTSETGAVLHDIMNVARKKNLKTDFVLYPVKVQGEGAEDTIVKGINYFCDSDVDLVIIARGGGSFEDLAPFNTEKVARAIFACSKPIISAVGHETDFSISDFAADLRCATPSVASEVAVFDWCGASDRIKLAAKRIDTTISELIITKLDNLKTFARSNECTIKTIFNQNQENLKYIIDNIKRNTELELSQAQTQYEKLFIKIEKDSPMALLNRGYLIAENTKGRITKTCDINIGDEIKLTLTDGIAKAKVISKEKTK